MKLPVFDLHCDTALALSERAEVYTALRSNHRHVDLVRAGELGGYCQCFAMFTTPDFEKWYQKPVTEVFDNMLSNLEKEIKKKIKKDLDVLRATELTWKETVKGKEGDFLNVPIIGSRGIKGGYIHMAFDPVMAEYLIRLPLTQYPVALLAVDARNSNAYSIGLKMTEYYNMDFNQSRGKADRLSVPTLLSCTSLPTIEDVRSKRQGWERLIKEPLEKALEALASE